MVFNSTNINFSRVLMNPMNQEPASSLSLLIHGYCNFKIEVITSSNNIDPNCSPNEGCLVFE